MSIQRLLFRPNPMTNASLVDWSWIGSEVFETEHYLGITFQALGRSGLVYTWPKAGYVWD